MYLLCKQILLKVLLEAITVEHAYGKLDCHGIESCIWTFPIRAIPCEASQTPIATITDSLGKNQASWLMCEKVTLKYFSQKGANASSTPCFNASPNSGLHDLQHKAHGKTAHMKARPSRLAEYLHLLQITRKTGHVGCVCSLSHNT